MRSKLTSLGELVGLALVSTGAWIVTPAAGLIAAGVGLFAVAYVQGDDE